VEGAEDFPRIDSDFGSKEGGSVGLGDAAGGAPGLIERERELARISELLGTAAEGNGTTVLIEGVPGIGKTALLQRVSGLGEALGMTVLSARAGELERELGFAVVRGLLEPAFAELSESERDELLTGAAALAAGPLGLNAEASTESGAMHGLYWLCANLAERSPLLMVVDDLHWADEPSLRFLSYLARRAGDQALLICAASRPEADELRVQLRAAVDDTWAEVLRPEPLSEDGVATVVRALLSDSAEPEFCAACARSSGGNPFLLVEALTALRADGIDPTDAEARRLEGLRPESLSRALLARIARIGPEASGVARAVAVLGADANLSRAATLAEVEPEAAAQAIEKLRRDGVFAPGEHLEFAHPLVRNAVYSDIAGPTRGLNHLQAARLIDGEGELADRVTSHLLAGETSSDPWVVSLLRSAAADALARGAPEPAVALLDRAMAEPPAEEDRAGTLLDLGRARARNGNVETGAEAMRGALERTADPAGRAAVVLELASVLRLAGRFPDALELLEGTFADLGGEHPELALALENEIAIASHLSLPASEWIGRLASVAERATGPTPPERLARALYAFAAASTGSLKAGEVGDLARSSASTDPQTPDPPLLLQLTAAGMALAGDYAGALQVLDQSLDAARRMGDAAQFAFVSLTRSWVALRAGRVLESEADARAGLEAGDDGPLDLGYAVGTVIAALVERGELDASEALLNEHELADVRKLESVPGAALFGARGRLRRLQGRPGDALLDLDECGRMTIAAGYHSPTYMEWRHDKALVHLALGEDSEAQRIAAEDLELSSEFGGERETGMALRASGLVAGGERGLELLRKSVTVLETSQAALEHGRSRVELGAALRRAGQRTEAREELRRGLDLVSACGATAVARQAREELTTAGARPRRERLTGPDSLTASEVRVARMAADGRSNPEIAQALFVTRRTVEVHLTSVYRKLEIKSREGLPAALSADPAL